MLPEETNVGAPADGAPAGEAAPAPPADAPEGAGSLRGEVAALRGEVAALREELGAAVGLVREGAEAQQLGAEQLRRFGRRLEQVASAAADDRLRELARGLVLFHDLLDGLAAS